MESQPFFFALFGMFRGGRRWLLITQGHCRLWIAFQSLIIKGGRGVALNMNYSWIRFYVNVLYRNRSIERMAGLSQLFILFIHELPSDNRCCQIAPLIVQPWTRSPVNQGPHTSYRDDKPLSSVSITGLLPRSCRQKCLFVSRSTWWMRSLSPKRQSLFRLTNNLVPLSIISFMTPTKKKKHFILLQHFHHSLRALTFSCCVCCKRKLPQHASYLSY